MRLRVFVTLVSILGCGGEKLPGFGGAVPRGSEPCDMSLTSTIELPVPDKVLAAEEIVLLTPGGGRLSLRR